MNSGQTISQDKHYWRKDITGLRAVAVLPVLLYHAFPNALPGGFFGVDIFFIISGYLIAGIIFRGLLNNSFSYIDFYVKRIKRILPNLITLLLSVCLFGWFVLGADEYSSLGRHTYSSAEFYQNFRLLSDVDYFDVTANQKPLLHLWSLAIEEQFYIVFPILCTLIWSFSKQSSKAIGSCVLIITIGSLMLCLCTDDNSQRFYFPLSRFWELGIGIIIAYLESFCQLNTKCISKNIRSGLSILGLFLIGFSVLYYDSNFKTPGLFSLLPTMGGALLIWANDDALINRSLLSWKPMSFIGLISYSLYLWHWPIIAYLNIVIPNAPQWYYGVALLLSFPIAIFVYSTIENPIRRIKSKPFVVYGLITLLAACIGLGQIIKAYEGFPSRDIAKALNFSTDFTSSQHLKKANIWGVDVAVTNTNVEPNVLFIGDSHIHQYAPRAKVLNDQMGTSSIFVTYGGCLASIGFKENNAEKCKQLPHKIETLMSSPKIKTIVIGQIWGLYKQENPFEFEEGVNKYIELIRTYGNGKNIYVLLDAPWDYGSYDPKQHITNRLDIEGILNADLQVTYPQNNDWLKGNLYIEEKMSPYATIIKTEHLVCPDKLCNLRYYKDDDHLRASYVKDNATWIDNLMI